MIVATIAFVVLYVILEIHLGTKGLKNSKGIKHTIMKLKIDQQKLRRKEL